MTAISLENQIRCVQREIALRERVYPRFVAKGSMKLEVSVYEIEAMKAVLATLLTLEGTQKKLNQLEKELKPKAKGETS